MQPHEILVVEAEDDARPLAVRVPRPANEAEFRGTGPERGAWEELRRVIERGGSAREEADAVRSIHRALFGERKRAA